jgi:hypothetical protein
MPPTLTETVNWLIKLHDAYQGDLPDLLHKTRSAATEYKVQFTSRDGVTSTVATAEKDLVETFRRERNTDLSNTMIDAILNDEGE